MWTVTKYHLMYVCALALLLSVAPTGWAENLTTDVVGEVVETGTADDMNKCETGDEPFAQVFKLASAATSPGGRPNKPTLKIAPTLKIVSIDPVQRKVTAQSVATGEIIHFTVAAATLKGHLLQVGQTISTGRIIKVNADGRCACGQKSDGSCWCVSSERSCCGPLHGCPIGSCGKLGPVN